MWSSVCINCSSSSESRNRKTLPFFFLFTKTEKTSTAELSASPRALGHYFDGAPLSSDMSYVLYEGVTKASSRSRTF